MNGGGEAIGYLRAKPEQGVFAVPFIGMDQPLAVSQLHRAAQQVGCWPYFAQRRCIKLSEDKTSAAGQRPKGSQRADRATVPQ
jgi:hypothetical protein